MANVVGRKYQVVIDREARKRLGVEPGAVAIQRVVGDRLEIHFVSAKTRDSAYGVLAKYIQKAVPDPTSAAEDAWAAEAAESVRNWA